MSVGIVAETYSSAILDLAEEQNMLESIEQDLAYVGDVLQEHKELRSFLMSPILTGPAKTKLLGTLFGQAIHKTALHFLYVMIDRGRYRYIEETIRSFIKKAREARGIVDAIITVAEPLAPSQEQSLLVKLKDMTGKEVMFTTVIDPTIMGGFVVQIGDTRIDASIARRLSELQKTLTKKEVIG